MMIEGRSLGVQGNFSSFSISSYGYSVANRKPKFRRMAVLATFVMFLLANFMVIFIFHPISPVSAQSIEQRVEPVIVLGSELVNFDGVATDEIWVYAYTGGEWKQIPFQIDERNDLNGSYFFDAEDGVLDGNDEIIFMPFDAGYPAPASSWVLGTEAQRYEIMVTDPIDSSMKYVYLYNSSILTKTFTEDYVHYDPISHVIKSSDYTIGFDDIYMGLMDEMRVNTSAGGDNTDILDRYKFRLQVTPIITPKQVKEEDFDYNLVDYKDGPLRVIQKVTQQNETADFFIRIDKTVFAYKSFLNVVKTMDINISADWMRISLDFLNSSSPMKYYDSNLNDLTIDGSPDTPISTDIPTWSEVTGSHGTLITIGNFSELGGTQSLYYNDYDTSEDQPEYEPGEYGNHGVHITDPLAGSSTMYFSYYFLGAEQGNIGSTYSDYSLNPITITTLLQEVDPSPPPEIREVISLPDPQEVFGNVNISAIIEDNMGELYGAWIDITDPGDDPVGNYSMAYDSNTNRYYHNGIYDKLGTFNFIIWANDTSNNWNSSSGQFMILDTTSPTITDITAIPYPQEVNGQVNISVAVEDVFLDSVWVTVTNPNGYSMGNFTMSYDLNGGRYYYKGPFNIVGTYNFIIWAKDTSGNWNSSSGQLETQDTTSPEANAGLDLAVNMGTIVSFDGSSSTDNVEIVNYTWTFTDVTLQTLYGDNPTHSFENVGSFEVTLNVSDASGNWDTDTMWVNVSEVILTGSISGTVNDEDGDPIQGAIITLVGTSYVTTTDETGYYLIQNITAGVYDIEVTIDGYEAETITNVRILAGQDRLNEDFVLKKVTEGGGDNFLWIILIIGIILVILLLIFLLLPRLKKEKGEVEALSLKELRKEPTELAVAEEKVEEYVSAEPPLEVVEPITAAPDYEAPDEVIEDIEVEETELDIETIISEDFEGSKPEDIDIEKELGELLREAPDAKKPKKELKDELEELSKEIDKILNETKAEETEDED